MKKPNGVKPPVIPQLIATATASERPTGKTTGAMKYVAYKGLQDYGTVAFGINQNNHTAPLSVPNGFATQVPYNSAINSTIIQNPSAIPVTTYYQIMTSHPVAYQSMAFLITTIISRVGDYKNNNKECEKVVRNTIKRWGKIRLLQGLLSSLWGGHADLKLNWGEIFNDGSYKPFLDDDGYSTPENILVLPQDSILLAVTPEGLLDPEFGVMQYYYNLNSVWQQNGKAFSNYGNAPFAAYGGFMNPQRQVAFNPMFLSTLPEEWRVHHVFNPTGLAGNHYGESLIKAAFGDIVEQANLDLKLQVALTYKSQPLTLIETDSNTTVVDEATGETTSMAENMKQTMDLMAATGIGIVDGLGAIKVQTVDNTANIDQMVKLRESYDARIRTALLSPNITGNEGSYANSVTNNKNLQTIINNFTLQLMDTLIHQVVKKILDNAIGDYDDCGYFELKDTSLDDMTIYGKILESAAQTNVFDMSSLDDINHARVKLDMQPLDKLTEAMKTKGQLGFGGKMGAGGGADMGRANQSINKPYANGLGSVTKNTYSGKEK